MERIWAVGGAIGAGLFVGSVMLLLPPTATKASWTSATYSPPARMYDPPAQVRTAPAPYDVAYRATPGSSRPDDRNGSDEAYADEATVREIVTAEADRAYGDGYAWAAEREVAAPRECRRLDGPRAAGCRDYVASLAPDEREPAEAMAN